jgi:hypothetical protein
VTGARSFTRSSSGDIIDATKLNWPIGRGTLQNARGEYQIHDQCGRDRQDKIGRRPRQRPEIEQFIGEQHGDKKRDADPLGSEPARNAECRGPYEAARVADEHERAARAEQVAGRQQRHDQQSAVVDPRQNGREVCRIDSRGEQAVKDDDDSE